MHADQRRWREARDRFAALLDNPRALEREWQELFTTFPFVLTDCLALGIVPDRLMPCRPGAAEADFYFFPEENNPLSPYGVIEIKRPSTKLLSVPRSEVVCLSADVTAALAQAKKYAAELNGTIAKPHGQILALGNSAHVFVIAGLAKEISRKVSTRLMADQVASLLPPGCRLIPFDALSEVLNAKVPPRLHIVLPSSPNHATPRESVLSGNIFRERARFAVVCTSCGKDTFAPFQPTPGRLVLCIDCYRTHRRSRPPRRNWGSSESSREY